VQKWKINERLLRAQGLVANKWTGKKGLISEQTDTDKATICPNDKRSKATFRIVCEETTSLTF
jgi:hypothetical protein